jgi:hypothetical protein
MFYPEDGGSSFVLKASTYLSHIAEAAVSRKHVRPSGRLQTHIFNLSYQSRDSSVSIVTGYKLDD